MLQYVLTNNNSVSVGSLPEMKTTPSFAVVLACFCRQLSLYSINSTKGGIQGYMKQLVDELGRDMEKYDEDSPVRLQ